MRNSAVLIDASPLVALLNASDPHHGWIAKKLAPLAGEFVTTGAVLTEAMHFLQAVPEGPGRLIELILRGVLKLDDCFDHESLLSAALLMKKYADLPMDFADASLVWLADKFGTGDILTLDERGFRTYRFRGNRRFRLLIQDD